MKTYSMTEERSWIGYCEITFFGIVLANARLVSSAVVSYIKKTRLQLMETNVLSAIVNLEVIILTS